MHLGSPPILSAHGVHSGIFSCVTNNMSSIEERIILHANDVPTSNCPQDYSNNNRERIAMHSRSGKRWLILTLSCVAMTGNYYSYDIPAALHQQLYNYMSPTDNFEVKFNLLYTVYSLPNVILPFFGGTIVDTIGTSLCMVSFTATIFVGQCLLTIGVAHQNWPIMLMGRVVYGLGGECVTVATSSLLSQCFGGKEIALAFGINLAVSRLGSVLNNIISPTVADAKWGSTTLSFLAGVTMSALSVVAALLIFFLERRTARTLENELRARALLTASLLENDSMTELDLFTRNRLLSDSYSKSQTDEQLTDPGERNASVFNIMFWLLCLSCVVVYGCVLPFNNVASGILLERNYFLLPPEECELAYPHQCTAGSLVSADKYNPSMDANGTSCPEVNYAPILPSSINETFQEIIYDYPLLRRDDVNCADPFWSEACTSNYCDAEAKATEVAGRVMSIPYFLSAAISPPLGYIIDIIGCRAIMASLAPLILIFVHTTLAIKKSSPIVPLVFQGMAYSLYAAVLWPSVPLVIGDCVTGTAFGIITSIQNIGLGMFPLMIAAIYNRAGHEYLPKAELFFVACGAVGLVVGMLLSVVDESRGGKLNGFSRNREDGRAIRQPDADEQKTINPALSNEEVL